MPSLRTGHQGLERSHGQSRASEFRTQIAQQYVESDPLASRAPLNFRLAPRPDFRKHSPDVCCSKLPLLLRQSQVVEHRVHEGRIRSAGIQRLHTTGFLGSRLSSRDIANAKVVARP